MRLPGVWAVLMTLGLLFIGRDSAAQFTCQPGSFSSSDIAQLVSMLHSRQEGMVVRTEWPEFDKSRRLLVCIGKESPQSRMEVINSVVGMLKEPGIKDYAGYYGEWMAACGVLGDLKAVEAIDLLVEHVADSGGWEGINRANYPAAYTLVRIGAAAVPKLREAAGRPDRSVTFREAAVTTIGRIGGSEALDALSDLALSETNPQVIGTIRSLLHKK